MTTVHVSWQMRVSGLVVALLEIGGFWMAMIFGAEFLDLLALIPAEPLRMNDWRGWFAIFIGLLATPFMLYAGGRLMFSIAISEPDLSSTAVKRRGIVVISLIIVAAVLGLLTQKSVCRLLRVWGGNSVTSNRRAGVLARRYTPKIVVPKVS